MEWYLSISLCEGVKTRVHQIGERLRPAHLIRHVPKKQVALGRIAVLLVLGQQELTPSIPKRPRDGEPRHAVDGSCAAKTFGAAIRAGSFRTARCSSLRSPDAAKTLSLAGKRRPVADTGRRSITTATTAKVWLSSHTQLRQ